MKGHYAMQYTVTSLKALSHITAVLQTALFDQKGVVIRHGLHHKIQI